MDAVGDDLGAILETLSTVLANSLTDNLNGVLSVIKDLSVIGAKRLHSILYGSCCKDDLEETKWQY